MLCLGGPAPGAEGEAGGADWEPIDLPGYEKTFYVVPEEVLRELGLPREDIPREQNAAWVYLEAARALEKLPPRPGEEDEGRAGWDEEREKTPFEKAQEGPWDPAESPLDEWLEGTGQVHRLLRRAAQMEKCQFPVISQERGKRPLIIAINMPWVSWLREMVRLQEHRDDYRSAIEEYLLNLRMGAHLGRQPASSLISSLVAMAVQATGTTAIHECLQRNEVSPLTLKWLAGELAEPEKFLPDRAAWVACERAMALQIVSMPLSRLMEIEGEKPHLSEADRALLDSRPRRIIWPDRTIREDFQEFYDAVESACRKPAWEGLRELQDSEQFVSMHIKDWNILGWMLAPPIGRALESFAQGRCSLEALRIEVALRRFRAEAGRYPEKLSALVPKYLRALPPDPFSGRPFHYRREEDGWLLYSVGRNMQDDGGSSPEKTYLRDEGDIVFRARMKEETDEKRPRGAPGRLCSHRSGRPRRDGGGGRRPG